MAKCARIKFIYDHFRKMSEYGSESENETLPRILGKCKSFFG
jgi:hypothetical protein